MFVRLWMTPDPICTAPDTPVEEARQLMEDNEFRRLPVAEDGRLVGLLCESDLRTLPAAHAGDRVADHMIPEPLTVSPYAPIEEAVRMMREAKIGCLPVVHHEKLQGILTDSDVFAAIETFMEAGSGNPRVTFDMPDGKQALERLAALFEAFQLEVDSLVVHRRRADQGRKIVAARVRGHLVESFVDALWKKGYRVLQVLLPHEALDEGPGPLDDL